MTSELNNQCTVIDLFSGAGGTALGFQRAGFKIVGALDINPSAAKTYNRNIGVQPLVEDIRNIEPEDLLSAFNLQPGEVSVLVGCPPCQGFTRMRNEQGANDDRNDLVLRYLDFVEVIRPHCVVFENVPGIIKQKHGKAFYKKLCRGLKKLGYRFDYRNPGRTLNAADYGVPQLRERVVLIAGRDGRSVKYPKPTHGKPDNPKVTTGRIKPWRTVGDELVGLPPLQPGEVSTDDPIHYARSMRERVYKFISLVPLDGGSRQDVPEEYWLECHKKENCGHADVYGRLSLNYPSGVITTGCTNVSKGRFAHPIQNRGISFREAALLQSFPPHFVFEGNSDDIAEQIGNAVPPLLAQAIAKAIQSSLNEEMAISA